MATEKELNEFYVNMGARIRKARIDHGITQEQLADSLSLNRTSVTNIESGRQKILVHTLIEIADRLEASVGELIPILRQSKKSLNLKVLAPEGSSKEELTFLNLVLNQTKGVTKNHASSTKADRKAGQRNPRIE